MPANLLDQPGTLLLPGQGLYLYFTEGLIGLSPVPRLEAALNRSPNFFVIPNTITEGESVVSVLVKMRNTPQARQVEAVFTNVRSGSTGLLDKPLTLQAVVSASTAGGNQGQVQQQLKAANQLQGHGSGTLDVFDLGSLFGRLRGTFTGLVVLLVLLVVVLWLMNKVGKQR